MTKEVTLSEPSSTSAAEERGPDAQQMSLAGEARALLDHGASGVVGPGPGGDCGRERRSGDGRGVSEEVPTGGLDGPAGATNRVRAGVTRASRVGSRAQGALSKGARSRVPGYSWLGSGGEW